MGGQESSLSYKNTTSIVGNVLIRNVQNCGVHYNGTQTVRLRAVKGSRLIVKGGITQVQSATVNVACVTNVNSISGMQNEILQELTKVAEQANTSGLGWLNDQANLQNTDINTAISTSITKEFVQQCVASLEATQLVDVYSEDGSDIVIEGDIGQYITAKVIMECAQKSIEKTTLGNVLKTIDNQSASQESSGIFGGNMIKWIVIFFIIIVVLAGLGYGVYIWYKKEMGEEEQ